MNGQDSSKAQTLLEIVYNTVNVFAVNLTCPCWIKVLIPLKNI